LKTDAGRDPDFLHTGIIYRNWNQRNKMIDACIEGHGVRCRSLKVLSEQPDADSRHFASHKPGNSSMGGKNTSVVDARDIFRPDRDERTMLSLAKNELNADGRGPTSVLIGDFSKILYDRFHIKLDLEEASEELSDSVHVICCYKAEGFWSLDPSDIAKVFELHKSMMLGSNVIERKPTAVALPGSAV
jgi:hypothetical protein